ncbi:MAG: hypothetical protein R3C60_02130 [Parvularculaceae bacterium]
MKRELGETKKKLALGGGLGRSRRPISSMSPASALFGTARRRRGEGSSRSVDQAKKQLGSGVAVFVSVAGGKASLDRWRRTI